VCSPSLRLWGFDPVLQPHHAWQKGCCSVTDLAVPTASAAMSARSVQTKGHRFFLLCCLA